MGRRTANFFLRMAIKTSSIFGSAEPLVEVGKNLINVRFVEPKEVDGQRVEWDDTYAWGMVVPKGYANPVELPWDDIDGDEFDEDAQFVSVERYQNRMRNNFWSNAMQSLGAVGDIDRRLAMVVGLNILVSLATLAVVIDGMVL